MTKIQGGSGTSVSIANRQEEDRRPDVDNTKDVVRRPRRDVQLSDRLLFSRRISLRFLPAHVSTLACARDCICAKHLSEQFLSASLLRC